MSSRFAPWVALGLVVILLVALASRGSSDGGPLNHRGTGPEGAKGLVRLLDELGADVELAVAVPEADTDVALLLEDRLDADTTEELRRWVSEGGVLVVTDPFSGLAPFFQAIDSPGAVTTPGRCDIAALADVGELSSDAVGFAYVVGASTRSCFGDGALAFVTVDTLGSGFVVSVGTAEPFVNRSLDDADHAVLAGALLAPTPGTRVAVVERLVGSGDRDLIDLVGDNIWLLLVQLGVAFVVLALWQGRRLGRPVHEPQPVRIAGAELTEAVARLLERSGSPERAARLVRHDLHRSLAARLGAPATIAPDSLAGLVAERTGMGAQQIYDVLAGSAVITDDQLLALAAEAGRIRNDIRRTGRPARAHENHNHEVTAT